MPMAIVPELAPVELPVLLPVVADPDVADPLDASAPASIVGVPVFVSSPLHADASATAPAAAKKGKVPGPLATKPVEQTQHSPAAAIPKKVAAKPAAKPAQTAKAAHAQGKKKSKSSPPRKK